MSRTIVIANQKGGVGKTTTAVNLAACLGAAEKRTLLVDMDPQANATSGIGFGVDDDTPSVYEVLLEETSVTQAIQDTSVPYLSVLPSDIRLTGADVEMVNLVSREHRLKAAVDSIRGDFDFVLVDCPPSLGLLTLNALTAADSVLIPIQCEYYALEGLSKLMNTLQLVQKHLNPELEVEGVLLTMFDNRLNLARQVADEARKHFKDKVYQTVISRNVKLGEAPSFGKPIILYDILSSGAQSYMNLAGEVLANG